MAQQKRGDETPSAETRRDWEVVQEDVGQSKTERLRITSGWLVRTTVVAESGAVAVAMVFVDALITE